METRAGLLVCTASYLTDLVYIVQSLYSYTQCISAGKPDVACWLNVSCIVTFTNQFEKRMIVIHSQGGDFNLN